MKKIMNLFFLSCKRTTELIEKRDVESLSIIEKLQLNLHVSMCNACKSYEKQSQIIGKAVSQWIKNKKPTQNSELSGDVKSNIIKEIIVYDTRGKQIINRKTNQSELKINLQEYPSGIYFVEVLTNGGVYIRKIAKKK